MQGPPASTPPSSGVAEATQVYAVIKSTPSNEGEPVSDHAVDQYDSKSVIRSTSPKRSDADDSTATSMRALASSRHPGPQLHATTNRLDPTPSSQSPTPRMPSATRYRSYTQKSSPSSRQHDRNQVTTPTHVWLRHIEDFTPTRRAWESFLKAPDNREPASAVQSSRFARLGYQYTDPTTALEVEVGSRTQLVDIESLPRNRPGFGRSHW